VPRWPLLSALILLGAFVGSFVAGLGWYLLFLPLLVLVGFGGILYLVAAVMMVHAALARASRRGAGEPAQDRAARGLPPPVAEGSGRMARIRWPAVIMGAVVALLVSALTVLFVPGVYGLIPYEMLAGVLTLSLAHFLGGFVAGRMAATSPGLNGALTAVLNTLLGVVAYSAALMLSLLGSPYPIEWGTFFGSENLGPLFFWAMRVAVVFPITLLAGYLGGRLGGRFGRASGSVGIGVILFVIVLGIAFRAVEAALPPPEERAGLPPDQPPLSCPEYLKDEIAASEGSGDRVTPTFEVTDY
jgi:hypothetical protein